MEPYLDYLQNVLGIKSFLSERVEELKCARPHQVVDILFVNLMKDEKDSLQHPENLELFEKIKGAMKLEGKRTFAIDYVPRGSDTLHQDIHRSFDARYIVVMGRDPVNSGDIRISGPSLWMETFNPAYLLTHPGSKKYVWSDLQKIMKRMGLN